jgi:hypothetical protein
MWPPGGGGGYVAPPLQRVPVFEDFDGALPPSDPRRPKCRASGERSRDLGEALQPPSRCLAMRLRTAGTSSLGTTMIVQSGSRRPPHPQPPLRPALRNAPGLAGALFIPSRRKASRDRDRWRDRCRDRCQSNRRSTKRFGRKDSLKPFGTGYNSRVCAGKALRSVR